MKKIYLVIILCSIVRASFGQLSPLEIAEKVFSPDGFVGIKEYSTGDYDGHPNGKDLSDSVKSKFLLLYQDENTAVVNVSFTDKNYKTIDTYLHFVKSDKWKVTAFRSLALTGILVQYQEILENLTDFQIDSIIKVSNEEESEEVWFKSREEYLHELKDTRLTLASDEELIQHFKLYNQQYESLKDDLIKDGYNGKSHEWSSFIKESYKPRLNSLFIGSINSHGSEGLSLILGGMIDNTVGYMYVTSGNKPPKMTPNRYIMIREIGNGWFLFKTT